MLGLTVRGTVAVYGTGLCNNNNKSEHLNKFISNAICYMTIIHVAVT